MLRKRSSASAPKCDLDEHKATLNADECWVSCFNPTYGRDAIALVQASLIHVFVGGARALRVKLSADRYEPKATLNTDECWGTSLNPTYERDAIALSKALRQYEPFLEPIRELNRYS